MSGCTDDVGDDNNDGGDMSRGIDWGCVSYCGVAPPRSPGTILPEEDACARRMSAYVDHMTSIKSRATLYYLR